VHTADATQLSRCRWVASAVWTQPRRQSS